MFPGFQPQLQEPPPQDGAVAVVCLGCTYYVIYGKNHLLGYLYQFHINDTSIMSHFYQSFHPLSFGKRALLVLKPPAPPTL